MSVKKKCRKPWITPSLLKSINQKHKLYHTYIKNQNEINRKSYVDYKNLLTNLVRQSKKDYYDNVFRTTQNDIRKTWSHINGLLGRGKKTPLPNDMYHNDLLLKSDLQKAKYFNEYFIDLPSKINKEIPPVQTSYKQFLSVQNHSSSLYFRPTSVHEISNFVLTLKPSKACGSDDISPKVIKTCIQCIVEPLCDIFNKSLFQGIVPNKLKIAKVIPVFKKNDRKNIENYRPIALLPIFSKILEKIVYKRLDDFLRLHDILIPQQFGFRKNCSTSMGVLNLVNTIINAIDAGKFCLGVFLDLSKAFDTIDHDILLSKLEHYGIRGIALKWFKNYLHNRLQYVVVNGVKSQSRKVKYGVPQGSVLGPLLFLIYINDIINSSQLFTYSLFADDTCLLSHHKDMHNLILSANNEVHNIFKWFCCNKLLLNASKTQYVVFRSRGKRIPDNIDPLTIGGHLINRSQNVRFLGVTVDDHLTWKDHLSNVCTKVSRSVGVIFKLRFFLPEQTLVTLYNAIIMPHLTYCNVAWGNTYRSHINKLIVLQKKAIRLITNSNYRSPSNPLFVQLQMLPLDELVSMNCLIFMYKSQSAQNNSFLKDAFIVNSTVHSYNTRQRNLIHQPFARTQTASNSFVINCIKEWNKLPQNIRSSPTLPMFKHTCREYLFERLQNMLK